MRERVLKDLDACEVMVLVNRILNEAENIDQLWDLKMDIINAVESMAAECARHKITGGSK